MEPESNSEYRSQEYWEQRYKLDQRSSYDWFLNYNQVRPLIVSHVESGSRILDVGCGNSLSAVNLAKDGYSNVLSIDYAASAIERAQREYPQLKWLQQDVRSMHGIASETVDFAFDKGTFDALFSEDSSPWDPSEAVLQDVHAGLVEIWRVLKPGGKFLCISLGQPHFRKKYFEKLPWRMEVTELGFYFAYLFQKPN
jgi:ubiquinone/menaquinone biosynthesis C-methylase UbiE